MSRRFQIAKVTVWMEDILMLQNFRCSVLFLYFICTLGRVAFAVEIPSEEQTLSSVSVGQDPFRFVVIEYEGGSWEFLKDRVETFNRICIPIYLRWLRQQNIIPVSEKIEILKLSDSRIFDYPFLYLGGHYRFTLTDQEVKNLKSYMDRGGLLYIDNYSNSGQMYGPFSQQIQEMLKAMYPEGEIKLFLKSHAIFKTPFPMPVNRPPHIDPANYDPDRDGVVPLAGPEKNAGGNRIYLNGFYFKGRVIAIYSDAGRCPDASLLLTSDPLNGDRAFKIFTNILAFGMSY